MYLVQPFAIGECEHRRENFPDAEEFVLLNRRQEAKTDQKILSPSAVRLLTDRGHICVRRVGQSLE